MCDSVETRLAAALVALTICVLGDQSGARAGDRPGEDETTFVYTSNQDGSWSRVAAYLVDPDEALAAYVENGPMEGSRDDQLYNLDVEQGTAARVGPAGDLLEFLESTYARTDERGDRCDDNFVIAWSIFCPFSCDPPSYCNENFRWTVTLTCLNNPPCEPTYLCEEFTSRLVAVVVGGQPCLCVPNEPDGECTSTGAAALFFIARGGPICECVQHLDDWYDSTPTENVSAAASGEIAPGESLVLTIQTPASMVLNKAGVTAVVDLISADISVQIDETVDDDGLSEVVFTGGGGQFDTYLWEDVPVGVSDFEILSGTGYIHWQGGHATAEVRVRVTAAGFAPIWAVAHGSGHIDFETNTIEILMDSRAYEIGAIPAVTGMGLIVMTLLVLLAGTIIFRRARRGTPVRARTSCGACADLASTGTAKRRQ
ncbi:MAG: hypothetical protein ABIG44_00605 [Planctomycetota bacterium]